MKNIVMLFAVGVAFAGCGGGGGGGATSSVQNAALGTSSAASPAAPSAPVALAAYAGTWLADCKSHEQETLVVSVAPDGSATASFGSNFFALTGCTGPIVGTAMDGVYSVHYTDTVDATFSLKSGVPATLVKVARVTMSAPSYTAQFTGSGVTSEAAAGGFPPMTCIAFNDTEKRCFSVPVEPSSSTNGGMHIDGNEMFVLSPDGAAYKVDFHYTRK